MKFPFSNTLEGEAAGGSPIPAASLEDTTETTNNINGGNYTSNVFQEGFFRGAT
ncbi:hypothetical protein [Klebsiella pneumoniae]|uniref:hypothetical protein n=1 Tax=Klebsiella pneumoniae TaxID=573 RepID=UPI0023B2F1B6|nr:hypothetical protein [Klebsiella pneumoniae]